MTPSPLPIDAALPELTAALRANNAAVLVAPPGAGKTTRVPLVLAAEQWAQSLAQDSGKPGRILVLEPRRLAARAAARRMSQERGSRLGEEIGYHVRFDRQCGPRTRILAVTPGILLRLLHDDPYLESTGALIFDELRVSNPENGIAHVRLTEEGKVSSCSKPKCRAGLNHS